MNIEGSWWARGIEYQYSGGSSFAGLFKVEKSSDNWSCGHESGRGGKFSLYYREQSINSTNETRSKANFFSLMIYAGYPA